MTDLFFPNNIIFGCGSISRLGGAISEHQVQRPLLVTDAGLIEAGHHEKVLEILAASRVQASIFSDFQANPSEEDVEAGHAAYSSHDCDGLIGLGGGSAIDTAKAIRLKVNHSLPLIDYAVGNKGWEKMTGELPPLVAIPTTSGTGSEAARGSVIDVRRPEGGKTKVGIVGPRMYPTFSVCDPDLTESLPPHLTAGTGMDAFTHCIEEYLSPKYNPVIDGLALEGIRLCVKSLVNAYKDGSDMDARTDMMMAALMGGMGFIKGLGVVHSLAHPLGSAVGGHHGTTNAILLPSCLRFNFDHSINKFAALAQAAGLEGGSDEACGHQFIQFVEELNAALNMPEDLSVFSANREQIDEMIPLCMEDHCHLTNPRPCSEEDFRYLLEQSIPS